jgi:ABC-2 type transport system permease protein
VNKRVESPAAGPGIWLACRTLCIREVVRFLRQRARVIGALGTPLVFWLIVGAGLRDSFKLPGIDTDSMSYAEFSYPGAIAAILMFTAIFSTISLIDDRREGFLQGVLVAPGSRASIVLGKVLGGTALAVLQAGVFLVLAPVAGITLSAGAIAASLAAMVLVGFAVTSLGFWIAWRMESTQGFHAIMNLVLMPMLILSGAFFPQGGAARWMQILMTLNPMTYAVTLIRSALYLRADSAGAHVWVALVVTLAFAGLMFIASIRLATRETARTLQ